MHLAIGPGGCRLLLLLATAALALLLPTAAAAAAQADTATEPPLVLLVGDSTLAPQTGYGDALCQQLAPAHACLNLGRGGRSTLSYRTEGLWQRALARLAARAPGTPAHVLLQFGHNDQPGKPGRSTDLATEYPANLRRYVDEVRALGAQPVLVTPLARRSFQADRLLDDLQPWAQAMRDVAQAQQVTLLDLHALSAAAVQALGPAGADALAQAAPGQPGFDHTHVGARGACVFATLVASELARLVPGPAGSASPFASTSSASTSPAPSSPTPNCADVPAPAPGPSPPTQLNRATFDQPGWAVGTLGGRGGRILRVTSLHNSGPGTLRAALDASGPRLVVFEVGGVIDLGGQALDLRQPFITLAGQTAPAPGITLIRGELNIRTHDVIVQHLSIRPGAWGRAKRSGQDHDGISTHGGAHQVIVDHCSLSWATDENLSISGPRFDGAGPAAWRRATSHEITYSNNLIFEGLGDSVHAKGEHSKGSLVHDNTSAVLLLGNVYASNRERNALFKGGAQAAMVNNLVYNPGARAVHYNLVAHEWAGQPHLAGKLALVGNVLRHGPDTPPGTPLFSLGGHGDVELHLHDNLAVDSNGNPVPQTGRYTAGQARLLVAGGADLPAYLPPRLRVLPARQLEDDILLSAGARPWDRDPIDFKLLSDVAEGRGKLIDSETESSGYPRVAATTRPFDAAQWDLRDMSPRLGWATLFKPPRPA